MSLDLLEKIVDGLFLLPAANGGRFPQSHCLVVRGEVEVLIDAGCGHDRLREIKCDWNPDVVVASHAHPDHCSGLWLFDEVRLISPSQHADKFWRFEPQSQRFTEPGTLAETWKAFVKNEVGMREIDADEHFADGHRFDFGKINLTAVHAPGHLDDHYVFFEPHHGVALLFDIDLTGFGPWYGHREGDIDMFLAAIERVIALHPRLVVSSHKGVVTDDIEKRLRDYAAVFAARDRQLLAMLTEPLTLDELIAASPFYRGHPYIPPVLRYWEGNMIAKHLTRMAARGEIVREGERWRKG